jgi:hypothetical protein
MRPPPPKIIGACRRRALSGALSPPCRPRPSSRLAFSFSGAPVSSSNNGISYPVPSSSFKASSTLINRYMPITVDAGNSPGRAEGYVRKGGKGGRSWLKQERGNGALLLCIPPDVYARADRNAKKCRETQRDKQNREMAPESGDPEVQGIIRHCVAAAAAAVAISAAAATATTNHCRRYYSRCRCYHCCCCCRASWRASLIFSFAALSSGVSSIVRRRNV